MQPPGWARKPRRNKEHAAGPITTVTSQSETKRIRPYDRVRYLVARRDRPAAVRVLAYHISYFAFRISYFAFRISGFGFRISGFEFRPSPPRTCKTVIIHESSM